MSAWVKRAGSQGSNDGDLTQFQKVSLSRELTSTVPTILAGFYPPEMTEVQSFRGITMTPATQHFKNQQAAENVI